MPIIETQRPDIAALSGLHLWHAAMSNCSQRVRLVLEEKSLSWTSHLIDLFGFEHASADYQSIHPRGLVPALVHDGRTIIDSNDIIRYLDTEFPEPSLASEQNTQRDLMNLADACQLPLRTVSHELMLGDVRRPGSGDPGYVRTRSCQSRILPVPASLFDGGVRRCPSRSLPRDARTRHGGPRYDPGRDEMAGWKALLIGRHILGRECSPPCPDQLPSGTPWPSIHLVFRDQFATEL